MPETWECENDAEPPPNDELPFGSWPLEPGRKDVGLGVFMYELFWFWSYTGIWLGGLDEYPFCALAS